MSSLSRWSCLYPAEDLTSHPCPGIACIFKTHTRTGNHAIRTHLHSEKEDVDYAMPHTYRVTLTPDLNVPSPFPPGLAHPKEELMHYSPAVDDWIFVLREGSLPQ